MKQLTIILVLAGAWAPVASAQLSDVVPTMAPRSADAVVTWVGYPPDPRMPMGGTGYDFRYSSSPILTMDDFWALPVSAHAPGNGSDLTHYQDYAGPLAWNTLYYFGVYGYEEGLLIVVTGSTPDDVAPADTVLSASASSGSVTLTWTAPGDDGMAGQATAYDIRYSTSGLSDAKWNDSHTIRITGIAPPGPPGHAEILVLSGLPPGQNYSFGIKTSDEWPNWSPLAMAPVMFLDADVLPPAATLLRVEEHDSTRVLLGWTAPGDDGSVGTAALYDLRYCTSGPILTPADFMAATPVTGLSAPAAAGTLESADLGGLLPRTTYYFAIRAADEGGLWGPMGTASASTEQAQGSIGATAPCSSRGTGALPMLAALVIATLLRVRR